MPSTHSGSKSSSASTAGRARGERSASAASPGDYQKAVLRALADGPRTLKQLERDVAGRVGVSDESPVEAQLDAMTTAGVVKRRGTKFQLSDHGAELAGYVPEPAAG